MFANEDNSITKWLPSDATWFAFEEADVSGLNGESNIRVEVAVHNKKNNSIVIAKESARVKMPFSKQCNWHDNVYMLHPYLCIKVGCTPHIYTRQIVYIIL